MSLLLLDDVIVIFVISIITIFAGHRFKVPEVVGFLATGVVAGPHGLGLIREVDTIEILAEVGVIFLLFAIGIEFSFERLLRIRKSTMVGGPLQVAITLALVTFIGLKLGLSLSESIFFGFLISLSSTAVVLKLMQDRSEMDSPHGHTTLGILIFQDIVVVPMMLFIPLLAPSGISENLSTTLLIMLGKGLGMIALVILGAKIVVPRLLYRAVRLQSRVLFLLIVMLICLSVAWISYTAGLSLPLGAFLAGLIISESEYSYQALGNILPFRDVFTSIFFVSIGMLLDVGFFLERPELVLAVALGVLLLKSTVAGSVTLLLGYPMRTVILVGLSLAQIGEFSFILSKTGLDIGLISEDGYQLFLTVSVITMAFTPFMMMTSGKVADLMLHLPIPEKLKTGLPFTQERLGKKNHVIIVGFGFVGRNLARAARVGQIHYVVLEINPEVVRLEKAKGVPILYGDATMDQVLRHADVEAARVLVVAVSDEIATERITKMARTLNPKIYIMARVRYLGEAKRLYELGADEVIPEEFETSVEIFSRMLRKYLVPRHEINNLIAETRSHGYEMFRDAALEPPAFCDLMRYLPEVEIVTINVEKGSPAVDNSLANIDLRTKYGVNVLGIIRDSHNVLNPEGYVKIASEDVLLVLGNADQITNVKPLFRNPARYHRVGALALRHRRQEAPPGSNAEIDYGRRPTR